MKRRSIAQKWQYVGLGLLAVVTAGTVAGTLLYEPPAPDTTAVAERAEQYSQEVRKKIDTQNAAYAASLIANVEKPVGRPLRFMVPGDSLSGGYYSSTEAKSFRALVRAGLSASAEVEELKASQAGANLSTVGGLVGIPKNLDLAIIELGTNDTAGKTTIKDFTTQYQTLLRTIRAGSPKAALVCVGPWGAPGTGTDPYDKAIETVCKEHRGQFVKISTVFAGAENRSKKGAPSWLGPADDFHPNDLGHQKIADLILERIKVS